MSGDPKDSPQQSYQPKRAKPQFITIDKLVPASVGFNITARVISKKIIRNRENLDGSRSRIAEAVVGDSTGCIIFSLRNDQIDQVNENDNLILRNGKIDMVNNGFMRVAIDRWGLIETTENTIDDVDTQNNLSLIEYELANDNDD